MKEVRGEEEGETDERRGEASEKIEREAEINRWEVDEVLCRVKDAGCL